MMEAIRKLDETMLEEYQKYLINEEKSTLTIEKYVRDIRKFFFFSQENAVEEITKVTVIQYKERLMGQYMPSSVNSMLAALNHFFEFVDWQDLQVKLVRLQRQMFCPEEKELSRQEYFRLIAAAKKKGQSGSAPCSRRSAGRGSRSVS